jgi:hypothetical protein
MDESSSQHGVQEERNEQAENPAKEKNHGLSF